jgi:hypothetical protein
MIEAVAKKDDNQVENIVVSVEDYKFNIDKNLLDDLEVIEMIDDIESNERSYRIVGLLKVLLGEKQYKEMKVYFSEKHGKIDSALLTTIMTRIFEKFDPKG